MHLFHHWSHLDLDCDIKRGRRYCIKVSWAAGLYSAWRRSSIPNFVKRDAWGQPNEGARYLSARWMSCFDKEYANTRFQPLNGEELCYRHPCSHGNVSSGQQCCLHESTEPFLVEVIWSKERIAKTWNTCSEYFILEIYKVEIFFELFYGGRRDQCVNILSTLFRYLHWLSVTNSYQNYGFWVSCYYGIALWIFVSSILFLSCVSFIVKINEDTHPAFFASKNS